MKRNYGFSMDHPITLTEWLGVLLCGGGLLALITLLGVFGAMLWAVFQ